LSYANVSIMYYKVMSLKLLYGEITLRTWENSLITFESTEFPP
jgi:hypothetical protein